MTTRSRKLNDTPGLADLESAADPAEVPGIMPPLGTEARIRTTVDYNKTIVEPHDYYSSSLRELAAEELSETDRLPEPDALDPLQEFLTTWQNFTGYYIRVTRLPDPANNLLPGQQFNRECREITALGGTTFDPLNFERSIQSLANNSGGVFRVFLVDQAGHTIPGAQLNRITIADPPKQYNRDPRDFNPRGYNPYGEDDRYYRREREPAPPPQPPPKSETELYIEQMQRELFQKVMMRALDPPVPPTPDPLSALPADTRLALGLLQEGDVLKTAISRITDLAQAPDRIESATWKDKLADAGLQLVTNNPQILETATDILSRTVVAITTALSSAFAPRPQQPQIINEPIPVQHPPAQRVPVPRIQRAPQAVAGLPETPQPEDEGTDAEDDPEIDMMEEIVELLLGDKPLSLNDPMILDLRKTYPSIFDAAMLGLTQWPSDSIIQYLCAKSKFCSSMFQSSVTGPHLRRRLEELKGLLNANVQTTETENTPETDTAQVPAV